MLLQRSGHGAVVLTEIRNVLDVGGGDTEDELFDVETDTFSRGLNMESERWCCGTAVLENSRVVVVGKYDRVNFLSASNIKSLGPAMTAGRMRCAALPVSSSRVLVMGGQHDVSSRSYLSTTAVIDRATSSPGPCINTARSLAAAVLLPEDGGVLILGGSNNARADLATTEVLDVTGDTSAAAPKLGSPCSSCAVVQLSGEHVPVIGGFSDYGPVSIYL